MGRRKKIDKEKIREKLLSEAIRQFSNKGFYKTSFQSIADKSKVSQMTVVRQFTDKTNLLNEVIGKVMTQNHSMVQASAKIEDSAMTKVMKFCEVNIIWAKKYPDQAQVILLLYYSASYDKSFSQLFEKILTIGRTRVKELLYAAKREGDLKVSLQMIPECSEFLHEALMGIIINIISSRGLLKETNEGNALKKIKSYLNFITN